MFDNLSTADLRRMADRAWRTAALSWSEYRREPKGSSIKSLLHESAISAEAFWNDAKAALAAREAAR